MWMYGDWSDPGRASPEELPGDEIWSRVGRVLQLRPGETVVGVDTVFCTCQNDQSGLIGRRRVTVYADSRENQLVKMVADEWW